jgi:hypothetical protein
MEGYVYIDQPAPTNNALKAWLDEAVAFVKTLPVKAASAKTKEAQRTDGDRECIRRGSFQPFGDSCERPLSRAPTPSAKVHFLCFPPVQKADLEGPLRVELVRSQRGSGVDSPRCGGTCATAHGSLTFSALYVIYIAA